MMRQNRKQRLTIAGLAFGLALVLPALAATPACAQSVVTAIVTNPLTGIALDGYDPVSYFTETEPKPGLPEFEVVWGGVPWYFATAANRDVFRTAPDVYAPQFGGHDALALSRGYLSDGNPRNYVVTGQRLFLMYSPANREAFLMSPDKALIEAYSKWPALSRTLSSQ